MKTKYNFYLLAVGLVLTTVVYTGVQNNNSLSDKLELEGIKISQLEKNILRIENENNELRTKFNKSDDTQPENILKQEDTIESSESALHDSLHTHSQDNSHHEKQADNDLSILEKSHFDKTELAENVDGFVDINKPFNGVDPTSVEQQDIYTSFKYEIDGYNFNERFDMKGFLSDSRLSNLHASLGVKLLDYVDMKLKGIKLLQHSDPESLTEIMH